MRNETTTLRRPKTWVTVLLALGHVAIIVGLAVSALSDRGDATRPMPAGGPSILECSDSESPATLR